MARRRFVVQPLEDRLTPSFTVSPTMSPEEVRQFTETRADMYAVETGVPAGRSNAAPALELREFTPVRIDHGILAGHLADAPREFAAGPAKVFAVPRPDGSFDRFNVWEVQMMAPELAAKYPDIHTWRGQGIDDPTAVLVADVTPLGFHAQVIGSTGRWYVDPYYHLDTSLYAVYTPDNLQNRHGDDHPEELIDPGPPAAGPELASVARPTNGQTLRVYRTAVAATGEYTRYFGGTVAAGQAAIVTAINRVSGIYETELAIRLELVANNAALVFTNAATDPYTNNDGLALLGQNQRKVDAVIGSANYDLGHVFSTGGGGLAYLRSVGKAGLKARGVTGLNNPIGDSFYVDYVAHEIGHQFGANHTFNGVTAGPNRHGATAYEPGSGSTIMSYAGIMGDDDLQAHSDPYFHAASLNEISNYIASGAGAGFTKTPTGNTIPTADAGPDWIVPAKTPFALTGAGNDPDGDVLTYTWEQYNLGPAKRLFSPDNSTSPLFKSRPPSTDPTRLFPILSNTSSTSWDSPTEHPPETGRTMKFRLTVRDNRSGGGAYSRDDATVRVVNTGKAFKVTFPNTFVGLPGGSTQTVTWDVAKTDRAPINAGRVNVLLSTDNGQTFAVLAGDVPNDGSQDVVLPNLTTNQARIKVEPVGNVFFDVGDKSFSINAGPVVTAVASPLPAGKYELGAVIPLTVQYSAPVNVTGVPQLRLNSGGVANYVSGSGTNVLTFSYTVGAGDMAADLDAASTTALELNGGTITKPGGFAVARTLPFPGTAGSLSAASDIWVDTADTASVVGVASPAANGTYGAGDVVPITVSFDRPVDVTGLPQLQLNSHARAVATYVSGSGTDTLTFNYVVGPADSTSDLDYAATDALVLNGGTIVSPITGSAAVLTLPTPGSAGSLAAANDLFIGDPSISFTDATYETVEGVGTFTVTVLRIGDPAGAVSVDSTVTAGTAGDDDYTVASVPSPLTWADGDNTPREIVFQITDDDLSEGWEALTLTLSNLLGPVVFGIDRAVLTLRPSDGLIPGKFTDADGDVATISLYPKTGAGSLLVYLTNGAMPVSLLETTGTNPNRSAVSVVVRRALTTTDNGTFAVGGVVGSGVKVLNLARSPVTGDGIHLDGMLRSLRLDSVGGGADVVTTGLVIPGTRTRVSVKNGVADGSDFRLNAPVSTFTAGSFGDGLISAPRIGTLSVKGNFAGDVAVSGVGVGVAAGVPALGTMKVVGTVDGSAIDVTGIVGTVTVGSFLNSRLYVGYAGDEVGVGTYDPAGVISSFRTTAPAGGFTNSSVIASTVKIVTLASVDSANEGDLFGIYADTLIKTVTVRDRNVTYTNPATPTGFEDFEVKVM